MNERVAFERILVSLHEAALDDTRWSSTSALIDDALRVQGNTLGIADLHSGEDIEVYSYRSYSHGQRHCDLEREYFEVYFPRDERVHKLRQLPDSQLTHMPELYTEGELRTSALYNDYLARLRAQNGINVRLDGPDGSSIGWGVHDPLDGEAWSTAQLGLIRRLLPHIRQYARFRKALAVAGAVGASLTELLDTTGLGVIHLDRRGRILEVNDHARELLRAGDAIFDERGFLFARMPEDNEHLQELLTQALPAPGAQGAGGSTMARRASALPPLALYVNPVDRQETDFRVWPVAALVLVVDLARRTRLDPDAVGAALGLTGMESRVAVLLAEGKSVREVAAAMGRKEGTIRSHVKHIFTKHGLSRQAELVRLVQSMADAPDSRD